MTEHELLIDCVRRLNKAGVAYMLTGSMASNYWGMPRTTHDLDFVIQLPMAAIPPLLREFQGDYYMDEAAVRAASQPPYQFNAIDTRSALKVDFWLLRQAPFEREMFKRRIQVVLFGEPAWLATAEDVILHKLYWNRLTPSDRQLGDTAGVLAVQKDKLDTTYMRQWATELQVADTLKKILKGEIRPKST